MLKTRNLVIVLVLVLGSCVQEEPPPEKFCIYGYTCGDSIDDRISIEYTYDGHEQIQIGEYQNDPRVRFLTIHGDIWRIKFDSITLSEVDSLTGEIKEVYPEPPTISINEARGSKEWLWRDPIWNDKIVLSKMQKNNPDSLYSLYFEKPVISNWVTR